MNLWVKMPLWYRIVYGLKSFVAGFMTPTEWVEGLKLVLTGSTLQFSNAIIQWLWNFGDNILFGFVKGQTTWSLFKAISAAAQGDWSHFTAWPTLQQVYQYLPILSYPT